VGRNLLHNGLFNVQQRGAGGWTTSVYTADRWQANISLDTTNFGIQAITDAGRSQIGDEAAVSALACTFTGNAGAGSYTFQTQHIESVRRLGGKTVIVSFWANASAALRFGVSTAQNFGTGGTPSATLNQNGQAVTLSATWTRYSVVATIPSTAGMTLGTNGNDYTALYLWYSNGTASLAAASGNIGVQSGTINIWGVQLEVLPPGAPQQPTTLEKLDPRMDLANCQRFFIALNIVIGGWTNAATGPTTVNMQPFPTTMRTAPTVGAGATWTLSNAAVTIGASYRDGIAYNIATSAAGPYYAGNTMQPFSADL
jgi:hypothetical protein